MLDGGQADSVVVAGRRLTCAPPDAPPFDVSARVEEEDTFLVLSAPPVLREPKQHPVRTLTEAASVDPIRPGQVRVRGAQWLAVVHDLSEAPTSRVEWVDAALAEIWRLVARHRVRALALPPLGAVHGGLDRAVAARRIGVALAAAPPDLERIWLVVGRGDGPALLRAVAAVASDG